MVILYFRRLRTATNILILNLAIADLLIGIFCMPTSYWHVLIFDDQRWIFGEKLCYLMSFLQGAAVFLSAWTLVVISFDRWMAIMFVLTPSMRLTRSRAIYMVSATWIFSLTMALPLFLVSVHEIPPNRTAYVCTEDWGYFKDAEYAQKLYSLLVLSLQYAVPQTVLIITYTFIGFKMWHSRVPGTGTSSTKKIVTERHESVKKLIPMVILVSALFAICWLPILMLFNVVLVVMPDLASSDYILFIWWFCHGLAMSHSIVNPVVYFLRNARFREGFLFFTSKIMPFIKCDELRLLGDSHRRLRHGLLHSMGAGGYRPVGSIMNYREPGTVRKATFSVQNFATEKGQLMRVKSATNSATVTPLLERQVLVYRAVNGSRNDSPPKVGESPSSPTHSASTKSLHYTPPDGGSYGSIATPL
ncbi:unnamed protein product, partial [Mesorhabditis spiculigera]